MISRFLCVVALSSLFFQPAHASNGACENGNTNSCWVAVNRTSQNLSVQCGNAYSFRFNNLAPGQELDYQFPGSLADGVGYGEPGQVFNCEVRLNGAQRKSIQFALLNFGDHVTFYVDANKTTVVVAETWGTRTRTYQQY